VWLLFYIGLHWLLVYIILHSDSVSIR
jgi:hypothetical protein